MKDRLAYSYLVSTSYSGSTLLATIMNSHPEIASIGELANSIGKFFEAGKINEYYCSCGAEIQQCSFWKKVKVMCNEKGIELNPHDFKTNLDIGRGNNMNRLFFGITEKYAKVDAIRNKLLWSFPFIKKKIDQVIDRNVIIARAILDLTGKHIFFDTSKDLKRAYHISKKDDVDFKLVHLVRDPRGIVYSYQKRKGRKYGSTEASKSWRRIHGAALRFKSTLPEESYMVVKYEDLCEHTSATLERICDFINVQYADLVSNVNKQEHHIIGNPMRLTTFKGLKLDDSWKENISPEQKNACIQATYGLSAYFGYQ